MLRLIFSNQQKIALDALSPTKESSVINLLKLAIGKQGTFYPSGYYRFFSQVSDKSLNNKEIISNWINNTEVILSRMQANFDELETTKLQMHRLSQYILQYLKQFPNAQSLFKQRGRPSTVDWQTAITWNPTEQFPPRRYISKGITLEDFHQRFSFLTFGTYIHQRVSF